MQPRRKVIRKLLRDKREAIERPYYFEINAAQTMVNVETEAGKGFLNQSVTGTLLITKQDAADEAIRIPDCGIEILDENEHVVERGYTGQDGLVTFLLRLGTYYYREFDAPDGYILDNTMYPFEINRNGDSIEQVLTNDRIPVETETPPETTIPETDPPATASRRIPVVHLTFYSCRIKTRNRSSCR